VGSIDLWILWWPPQSLTRQTYVVPRAEVSILGVDVDAISADSLGVTAEFLLILLGLWNQVLGLIIWIPADPVQKSKAISHGDTNFGAKLNSSSCLAANNGTNLPLNQVDDAVGDAARLGVQQDALLAVQLADHEKFVPSMRHQARKPCPRSDQDIDSIKISLQVVELASHLSFFASSAWLVLIGNSEENSTCPATIISGLVFAKV
jgi:hypothetical protein